MNYKILLPLAAIIIVILVAVPIDSTRKDVYVSLTVEKPLIGNAQIQEVQVTQLPHTIMQIWQLKIPQIFPPPNDIVGSGTLKARLDTETAGASISLSSVWRHSSDTSKMVLADVPVSDSSLKVTLYEDNIKVDERNVILEAS